MDLDQLNRELAANHLAGFWTGNVTGFEQNIEPASSIVPHVWKWAHIYDGLMKARELVNMEMAERRTVRLSNPGGKGWATPTVHMSVQLVRPGEIAKAHRHSLTALRFIVQGNGACTTVDGARFMMSPGDLILTPNWSWHDHYNGTNEDIVWLDGHDGPLVKALEVNRVQMFEKKQQPVEAVADIATYKYGHARPYEEHVKFPDPPFKYRWEETYRALKSLAAGEEDPYDGVLLRYANPRNGGPTFRTISCEIQMLREREKTKSHRHSSHTIYHAFRGAGRTLVGDRVLEWNQGDCFTVPSWAWHSHENPLQHEAILFSITDRPLKEALGFYWEERRPD
jgi:gentisate 1,2-dioxygenase